MIATCFRGVTDKRAPPSPEGVFLVRSPVAVFPRSHGYNVNVTSPDQSCVAGDGADDRAASDAAPIKRAILVIHGIGQQRRFETLSDFVHGLIRKGLPSHLSEISGAIIQDLRNKYDLAGIQLFQDKPIVLPGGLKLGIEVFRIGKKFDSRCSLTIPAERTGERNVQVDVYESYWAQLTGGRTNFFRVVWWVIVTAFRGAMNFLYPPDLHVVPVDRFRSGSQTGRPPGLTLGERLWGFLKELCRLVLIVALLLLILIAFYLAGRLLYSELSDGHGISALFGTKWRFVTTALTFFYTFLAVRFVLGAISGKTQQPWYLLLIAAVVFVIAGWLLQVTSADVLCRMLPLVYIFLLIWLCDEFFTGYLGDVEVYTSGGQIGQNYKVRQAIIEQTSAKLGYILYGDTWETDGNRRATDYHEVIIVGHSLGSVIAYDVLCDFLRKEGGDDALRARRRVKHLFTVGSPLDKIWYFFRERPDPGSIVHQGILGRLKGVKATGITNSPLSDLEWTNLWVCTDFVSGKLEMYGDLVENVHLGGLAFTPIVNHNRYWGSKAVMRRIGGRVFQSGSESV